jgi:hypothetical protein
MSDPSIYQLCIYGIGENISILSKTISKLIGNSFILLSDDSLWNSASNKLWTNWNWLWLKNDSYAPPSLVRNGLEIQISHLRKPLIKVCKILLFSRHRLFLIEFWGSQITVMGSYRLPFKQSLTPTGYRLMNYPRQSDWLPVGYVYRWTDYCDHWIPSAVHPVNHSLLRTVLIPFSE